MRQKEVTEQNQMKSKDAVSELKEKCERGLAEKI